MNPKMRKDVDDSGATEIYSKRMPVCIRNHGIQHNIPKIPINDAMVPKTDTARLKFNSGSSLPDGGVGNGE